MQFERCLRNLKNTFSVIWVSHGGILLREAPEHLRIATPLEMNTFDVIHNQGRNINSNGPTKYVNLCEPPTMAEQSNPDFTFRQNRCHQAPISHHSLQIQVCLTCLSFKDSCSLQ